MISRRRHNNNWYKDGPSPVNASNTRNNIILRPRGVSGDKIYFGSKDVTISMASSQEPYEWGHTPPPQVSYTAKQYFLDGFRMDWNLESKALNFYFYNVTMSAHGIDSVTGLQSNCDNIYWGAYCRAELEIFDQNDVKIAGPMSMAGMTVLGGGSGGSTGTINSFPYIGGGPLISTIGDGQPHYPTTFRWRYEAGGTTSLNFAGTLAWQYYATH